MNRLPTEIVDEIASHLLSALEYGLTINMTWLTWLEKPNLAPYSTINRTWQEVIERKTFQYIHFNANTLPELQFILSGAKGDRRIRSIRSLRFSIIHSQTTPLTQHIEPEKQQRLANESFSENMDMLFGLLKGWEERLDRSGSLAGNWYKLILSLNTDCQQIAVNPPLPLQHLPRKPVRDWAGPVVTRVPLVDVQYVGKEMLPDLCLVSSVELQECHGIHPESVMQILSRMKHLVEFEGSIFSENRNLSLTHEYREVLAQCLHLLPRSVNVFCPDFRPIGYWRQTLYPVSLDPLRDHLCIGIRALSGQLRKLKLEGLRISPAIFAGDCDGSYPDWSRLENVDIRYPGLSSNGQWFFEEDPEFCLPFNLKFLNELYAEAGKAKQHMPILKSLDLTLDVQFNRNFHSHKFTYYFEKERNRSSIAVHSSTAFRFKFSDGVAEAWGFSKEAVESYKEDYATVTKVIF